MPTTTQVAVFVDTAEQPTIQHDKARPLGRLTTPLVVPENVWVTFSKVSLNLSGTPADAAAWFRGIADRIEAEAAAKVIADQHEPMVVAS